jgi:hypothetical protein
MFTHFKRGAKLAALLALVATSAHAAGVNVSAYVPAYGGTACNTTPKNYSLTSTSGDYGLTHDSLGNIYFSDGGKASVCKIGTDGNVVRIAGTGFSGIGYDNIAGTDSALSYPYNLATDATGNVYIADGYLALSIRKVATNGVITSVLNANHVSGQEIASGLAVNSPSVNVLSLAVDSSGRVVFVDSGTNACALWRIELNGYLTKLGGGGVCMDSGIPGPIASARFNKVNGIAFDANGNLFMTEASQILMVDPSLNISSVAGGGSDIGNGVLASTALVTGAYPIAVDPINNVFWGETGSLLYRKLDRSTGLVATVAGLRGTSAQANGDASIATFNYPHAMTIMPNGNLYISGNEDGIRLITGAASVLINPPSLSIGGNLIFRTNSTISATTQTAGILTFYQNAKAIPTCKNLVIAALAGGTVVCTYKPSVHGTVQIYAKFVSGGQTLSSKPYAPGVGLRITHR